MVQKPEPQAEPGSHKDPKLRQEPQQQEDPKPQQEPEQVETTSQEEPKSPQEPEQEDPKSQQEPEQVNTTSQVDPKPQQEPGQLEVPKPQQEPKQEEATPQVDPKPQQDPEQEHPKPQQDPEKEDTTTQEDPKPQEPPKEAEPQQEPEPQEEPDEAEEDMIEIDTDDIYFEEQPKPTSEPKFKPITAPVSDSADTKGADHTKEVVPVSDQDLRSKIKGLVGLSKKAKQKKRKQGAEEQQVEPKRKRITAPEPGINDMPPFDEIPLEVEGMPPLSFATFFEERVAQAAATAATAPVRCRAVLEAVGPMPLPGRVPRMFHKPLIWGVATVLDGDYKGEKAMVFAERRIWGYPVEAGNYASRVAIQ